MIKIPAKLEYILKTIIVLDLFSFYPCPQALLSGTFLACLCNFLLGYLKAGVPFASSHESYFLDTQ